MVGVGVGEENGDSVIDGVGVLVGVDVFAATLTVNPSFSSHAGYWSLQVTS